MNRLSRVIKIQINALARHWMVAVLLVLIALGVLYVGYRHQELPKALAYMAAMYGCVLVIDLFSAGRQTANAPLPVRQPRRESAWVLGTIAIGTGFLFLRFAVLDWPTVPGLFRLLSLLLLAFVFPIALAIYLLVKKYKLKELGFRISADLLVALPVIAITAGTALLIAREDFTFNTVLKETGGWLGLLFTGLITAGLSEEFLRMATHTRLGAWWNNPAGGWLTASLIWAFMHVPKWYGDDGGMTEPLLGALRIVPLGLMWGYLSYRTRNLLPATIAHGFNVWGLQNF